MISIFSSSSRRARREVNEQRRDGQPWFDWLGVGLVGLPEQFGDGFEHARILCVRIKAIAANLEGAPRALKRPCPVMCKDFARCRLCATGLAQLTATSGVSRSANALNLIVFIGVTR